MGNAPTGSNDLTVDEITALEQARSIRDGDAWYLENVLRRGNMEGAAPPLPPSQTPISDKAFNMIVMFEVTSQVAYQAHYQHPTWPQGASGVTIGIGYDVGYVSQNLLSQDWKDAIPDAMIQALIPAVDVRGADADQLAQRLSATVTVPWSAAITVHRQKVIPKWVTLVQASVPNTNLISPDSLGALVSLTYNRGPSFDSPGDRYTEMRAIKSDMQTKNFADVPVQIRSMERLWPNVRGLQIRREQEAALFESGLAVA